MLIAVRVELPDLSPQQAAQRAPLETGAVPSIATAPPANEVERALAAAEESPPAAGPQPAAEPAPQPPVDTRLAQQTQYLLQRGDRALADLRLTEPFEDSAAANYLAVLAIDQGNARATRGIGRIVDSYASMARFQLRKGKTGLARDYVQRARSVQPESKALDELSQQIDRASKRRRG